MAQETRELELKFELTAEELRRLRRSAVLRAATATPPVTRSLRTVYFDTPDHRLHSKGASLRVRRLGTRWLQTVKIETTVKGGVSYPFETEAFVKTCKPDLTLIHQRRTRRDIEKAVGSAVLTPVFETDVRRTTQRIRAAHDGEVELALDEGVVRWAHGSAELCEAELELKSGPVEALLSAADKLFARQPMRCAAGSKAERGYRLAIGQPPTEVTPRPAETAQLEGGQTCSEAFCLILQAAGNQVLHNWRVVLDSEDPEGAHQLRVGLRRVRTAFIAFRPLVDGERLRRLGGESRQLAQIIGELRDVDVLIEDVVAPVAAINDAEPGFAVVQELLSKQRLEKRERVRSALCTRPWTRFKLELALFTRTGEWGFAADEGTTGTVSGHAPRAMTKSWRKVARWARRLDALSMEERHQMRKALKGLRYTAEFFLPLYPSKATGKFVKKLKQLQDVFGYLNDVALSENLKQMSHDQFGPNPDVQRAVGYALGWHTARAQKAWEEARARWRRLETTSPYWM